MIALDTSALVALVLKEAGWEPLQHAITSDDLIISAATLTECLVVSARRGFGPNMQSLLSELRPEIVAVTEAVSRNAAEAYGKWGKGVHPAALNIMDCFSYALAKETGCPLLFVGDDFARTDVKRAI